MSNEIEKEDKKQKLSMQTLLAVGGAALFMLSNKKSGIKVSKEPEPEPIRSEKEIKIRAYIKEKITGDNYLSFLENETDKYLSFYGHYDISLKQLREIAEILEAEDVTYKSETERYDGDRMTIIEWT